MGGAEMALAFDDDDEQVKAAAMVVSAAVVICAFAARQGVRVPASMRILVRLPFCAHPVCLPVLLRLWRGRGTASPVQLARELILLLAQEFPDRCIHAVGDAAYHGKALLVERSTVTTRLPANAALYAPHPAPATAAAPG